MSEGCGWFYDSKRFAKVCCTLQLCSTAGEDLLTADSPGIKYHPTLKFWPGRDTNFDKLINYPTGDLWTGKLVDGMMEVTAVAAAV